MLFPTVSFAVFFLILAFVRQSLLRRGALARRVGPFSANDLFLAAAGVVFCAPLGVFFCAFVLSFAIACCVFDGLIGKAFREERRRLPNGVFATRAHRGFDRLAAAASSLAHAAFALIPAPNFRRRALRPALGVASQDWGDSGLAMVSASYAADPAASPSSASGASAAPSRSLSLPASSSFWATRARRTLRVAIQHRLASSFWVAVGCVAILLPLLILKYQVFFAQALSDGLVSLGLDFTPHWLEAARSVDWRAPAGASFLTFNGLALLMRRHIPRPPEPAQEAHWSRKIAFLSFFPALLSGPLWRLEPFMRESDAARDADWAKGSAAFALGFFLKVAIAGWAGIVADAVFQAPERYGALGLLMGAHSYGAQLYADFAGYSLMALGVGYWMGMNLPQNFFGPYLARGPREFWRRWHASLGAWFRDHLHIPLGGNRRGTVILARNSLIIMLVCGLWHGAGWTYMIWGAIHGAWLAIASFWAPISKFFATRQKTLHRGVSQTFGLTPIRWIALPLLWLACLEIALIAWIPFRCSDLACVNAFAHGLTDWSQPAGLGLLAMGVALLCLLATLLEQWLKNSFLLILERALLAAGPFWAVLGAALLWLAIWCSPSGLPNFIYFQF